MAKQACKCKPTECEECPEWIFTFADLVMLMMGFFVILWVLKPAPGKSNDAAADQDWIKLVAKIREAFDYLPDPKSKDPVDIQMLMDKLAKLDPMLGKGNGGPTNQPPKSIDGKHPEVEIIRPGQQAGTGGKVLFDAGQDTLTPRSISILDELLTRIKGYRLIMLVKGHASLDDFPDGVDSQKQMDLSIRRAKVVQDYLVAHGMAADVLRVEGCSVFEPVVQRQYGQGAHAPNRRVEIEVTNLNVTNLQDPAQTSAAAVDVPTTTPSASHPH
jgi:outer membrane protein OmpA-like peptidoglycan-associated protein